MRSRVHDTRDARLVIYHLDKGEEISLHVHSWDHESFVHEGAAWLLEESCSDRRRLIPGDLPDLMPAGKLHGFRADEDGTIMVNSTSKSQPAFLEALKRNDPATKQ